MKKSLIRYLLSVLCGMVVLSCCLALAQTETVQNSGSRAPGIVRIGVVPPNVQLGPASPLDGASEGVRAIVVKYLTGPSFEIVHLTAQLPSQAEVEGNQRGCDYILYSALSAKQKGLAGLGFLKGATQMTNMIPMLSAVHGAAGTIAGAAAGTVLSGAASVVSMIKAKSEISFQYRLVAGGNPTPVLSGVFKTKATQDGEDVVSAMVEKAAAAWVNSIQNRK